MATDSIRKAIFANVIDNKAIVIAGINEHTAFRLLGATMPTNVNLTHEYESEKTIVLYPNKGEDGVVAIIICAFDGWTGGKHNQARDVRIPAFLKVTWTGEGEDAKPHIDLDNPWFTADRIGSITSSGSYVEAIEVAIKERRFSSINLSRSHREGKAECNTSYGLDGNLLCKYLWGSASAGDVLHAAVQTKLEPLAVKRVERMTNEIRALQHEVRRLTHKVQSLETDNAFLEERRERAVEWNNTLLGNLVSMQDLRNLLKRIPRWLRPKSANEFIAAMDAAKV